MKSVKQHIEYFNFRCAILLDLPVCREHFACALKFQVTRACAFSIQYLSDVTKLVLLFDKSLNLMMADISISEYIH